jgi:hypothetical protein
VQAGPSVAESYSDQTERKLDHLAASYNELKADLERLASTCDQINASLGHLLTSLVSIRSLIIFACSVGFAAAIGLWLR